MVQNNFIIIAIIISNIIYIIMDLNINYILFVLIFLLIIVLSIYKDKEHFHNFQNIPKEFGDKIENIDTIPEQKIPKIIHHICPNDFKKWHPTWLLCYESWIRLYPKPEYTHMHWDNEELLEFIEKNYPWFTEIYKGYDVNIKRYDISRLFLLYHYGGIYADMDYMVYKNFFNELPDGIVSIPESPYKWNEHIQNSLMMSPPKHPWWLLVIDEAYNRKTWNVFSATGPQLLTPMYNKYPKLVNILSSELYNPNVYEPDKIDDTKIYSKHLLTTTWSHEDIRK